MINKLNQDENMIIALVYICIGNVDRQDWVSDKPWCVSNPNISQNYGPDLYLQGCHGAHGTL